MTFLRTLFLFYICTALIAMPAHAASVNGIRIGIHDSVTRFVVDIDGIRDYRVFLMKDPYRMAIDLPAYTWKASHIGQPKGSGVAAIRQGALNDGLSRIVVDLDKPVGLKSAYILPGAKGEAARLVIDFAPVAPELFAAERAKVFGTIRDASAQNTPSPPSGGAQALAPSPPPPADKPSRSAGIAAPERKPDMDAAPAPPPSSAPGRKPLIVVDPGHGGIDPGALGANGVFEKNVSLGMARELKKQLEATGRYKVLLTRDNDTFIKLGERVDFARRNHASLFVSLHADSISRAGVEGASIYTLSDKASDAQTEKLAARENRADLIGGLDMKNQDEQVATILVDLMMRDNVNQSRFFAASIVDNLRRDGIRMLENSHRSAGFAVLKAPDIPSVLIELGFMTSAREAAKLSSESYRQKVSQALVTGIDTYFNKASVAGRM